MDDIIGVREILHSRSRPDRAAADQTDRRTFLRGLGASGVAAATGLAGLGAASGTAAAASRSSYTIRSGTPEETTVYVVDAEADGPTVMVVGGIHGDEPAGNESAAAIADWDVDLGRLVVLPEANKQAVENGTRGVDGTDLNRQFPAGEPPETPLAQAIWDVVTGEDVDFLMDLQSSSGLYDGGSGDGVGQGVFSTQAGNAEQRRYHLQSYLNDNFVENPEYEFTGATSPDGSRQMLKHKVGADLDTPAIIFETYRGIDDARQRMFNTTAVLELLRVEGLVQETVAYGEDATAVNAPADDNDAYSGLTFGITNEFGQAVSVTDLEIRPVDDAADRLRDHSYDEGQWTSELHVAADEREGVVDVHDGVSLPASIDLDADGHDDAASTEPVLSAGSDAAVSLYQFLSSGSPAGMCNESVEFTLFYELADGTRGRTEFTTTS